MFKKILLSLVLTFAGGLTASAQEYHYIGVQGSWWNPDFSGEGFALEEYGDGFMIGYWYTYDDMGQQLWLIGTGERVGNTIVLEMNRTEGGILADPSSPERVVEEPWGTVTLQISDCGHIDMSYESLGGLSGGYPLSRLLPKPLAAGSCNPIQVQEEPEPDPPETDPPEEDPPEPEPAPEVTLQKRGPTGEWQDIEIPFEGLAVINKTYYGDPRRITLFSFRIVVNEGELVINDVSASEPTGISQPSVEGISRGMTFPQGAQVKFRLDSNLTGGERVYPEYFVHVEGVGEIVNLTVRLSTQLVEN